MSNNRILNDLTRIASFSSQLTSAQQGQQERSQGESVALNVEDHRRTPSLSTRSKSITASANADIVAMPQDFRLAQLALRCISELLKSLVSWCEQGMAVAKDQQLNPHAETPERRSEDLLQSRIGSGRRLALSEDDSPSRQRAVEDDPTQFENLKHRKTAITDAIKLFNAKPKRGIAALQRQGLLKSTEPREIASFLLKTEGLNKATIGEYLGEGDAENISIMHNFVDQLDFQNKGFVEALRRFLQTFRLPGESQKIDRFMLKFADRYCQGNPEAFANADTAYVLAYSVIMLNTDAHNSNLAKGKKMTKAEFLRNNSGIDDGKDLDSGLLEAIFDEIQTNEIVLKEEQDAALMHGSPNGHQGFNLSTALATVGRDLQREAYVAASQEMASKSEARFRNLLRSQKRSKANGNAAIYYSASHFEHVGPMFEVVWMPLLASLSGPLQRSDDIEIVSACLGAFRHAIRIVCLFELDLARSAFVRTLAWFTSLSNLPEMRPKHVLGIRTLLEVATFEGSGLKDSWKEVLTCISQLERLQLISDGIEQDTMPEMSRISQARRSTDTLNTRSSFQANRSPRRPNNISRIVLQEVASGDLMVAVDRIFSQSATLSGTAIVHFVRALTAVSSEEIFSSAYTEQPRMYSLQKVVEISYYNMKRIRFEWSNIWQILGEHFNEAGCNANPTISFFAIDALRQLASRFLEIDELPHFKFQKDFLKPFEFIFARTSTTEVKEMILQCINQMVQARSENIKSGWQTMFGVFTYAATEESESSVAIAFENVKSICRERISVILSQGSFPNLVSCLTVFAKISKHQRISLHALDCLRSTEKTMLSNQNFSTSASSGSAVDEQLVRYWFPILYGFHDILMTGDDMEVRSRALQYLFEALTEHGNSFTPEFWDVVCRQLLFPIFFVLKPDKTGPKLGHIEDLSIWLSTTMVEALRNLVQLYTTFFQRLEHMLGGFLDLLSSCICQENDTLARIGSACLQQLIIENADRFSLEHWTKVTSTFEHLFRTTTAAQLFQQNRDSLSTPMDKLTPSNMSSSASLDGDASSPLADSASVTDTISGTAMEKSGHELVVPASKRREFKSLIVKCVLQLLLIEAVSELLNKNDRVFVAMPHQNMIVVLDLLRESWQFARRFNADKELRLSLWKAGFMKQLPNLLRQEVASASGYVSISLKLIIQPSAMETEQNRDSIIQRFLM
jgi:brefeldin A-inhibited guanine nucleotide-exchange protein